MERREGMPELVYWGLWGLNTRGAALAFMWGCLLVGLGSSVAATRYPLAGYGAFLLLAAPWYWLSIRWVDHHSSWRRSA